jgi:hypothetical protein
VSAYEIDPAARTAREVWRFDNGQTVLSSFCSSVYEAPGQSLLVNYALADEFTDARLLGLDPDHNVVFEFEFPARMSCDTSWNAHPIPLEALTFE